MTTSGWPRRRTVAGRRGALAVAVLALAACGSAADPDARITGTAPVTAAGPSTSAASTDPALDAKAVLAATKRSVAFITAPDGSTGSGVLLPSGYVVTNAHVVQPFSELTLTFADGATISRVPVKGVDAWTDIALLGPIATDEPTLDLDLTRSLEQGDPVYLVGYPSETEAKPTPTITSGILSRVREVGAFGFTYLQADATIAGGQSGGALVDDRGRLVGITGYAIDGFSLALRAFDVDESVRAIADGKGSTYRSLPRGPGTTSGTLRLDERFPTGQLYLPPSSRERTMTLRLDDVTAPFQLFDLFDYSLYATNGIAEEAYVATLPPDEQAEARADLGEVAAPDATGTYTFTVPADVYGVILVGPFAEPTTATATARDVAFTAGLPVLPIDVLDGVRAVRAGDEVEGVLNSFDSEHVFTIDLTQGQRLPVRLVAPLGQLAIAVDGPGTDDDTPGSYAEGVETPFDGTTAETEFVAPADGRFTVYVFSNDVVLTAYRLTVG